MVVKSLSHSLICVQSIFMIHGTNKLASWQEDKKVGRSQVLAFGSAHTYIIIRFMSEFVYPRTRHSFLGSNFPAKITGLLQVQRVQMQKHKRGGGQEEDRREIKGRCLTAVSFQNFPEFNPPYLEKNHCKNFFQSLPIYEKENTNTTDQRRGAIHFMAQENSISKLQTTILTNSQTQISPFSPSLPPEAQSFT